MPQEISFPSASVLEGRQQCDFYRDAFVLQTSQPELSPEQVYHGIFAYMPKPVTWLLELRNRIVRPLGFQASDTAMALPLEQIKPGAKAGFLTIESVSDLELVCKASERNMDLWISVLRGEGSSYSVQTLVNLKTRSSRVYMALIKPFHKMIVRLVIAQALKHNRI